MTRTNINWQEQSFARSQELLANGHILHAKANSDLETPAFCELDGAKLSNVTDETIALLLDHPLAKEEMHRINCPRCLEWIHG